MSFNSLTGIDGIQAFTLTLANHGGPQFKNKERDNRRLEENPNKLFGIGVRLTRVYLVEGGLLMSIPIQRLGHNCDAARQPIPSS